MQKMNLDLKRYYLGMVKCHPKYYEKYKKCLGKYAHLPFHEIKKEEAIEVGIVTILLQEGDSFRDIFYSHSFGEFTYQLYEYNQDGVMLTYRKPFLDYYDDFSSYPMIYTQPKHNLALKLQEYLPYLISPNFDGSECIDVHDIDSLYDFYHDYVTRFCWEVESCDKPSFLPSFGKKNPFSLDDYYLGIIVCDDDYYKRSLSTRFLYDVNFDPFADIFFEDAMQYGTPTLLYKDGDSYYDIFWNRFDYEISYQENDFNDLGLKLVHVEPFLKWYPFQDLLTYPIITKVANNKPALDIQMQMPFLASYNTNTHFFDIHILDDAPMYQMFYDFYQLDQKKKIIKKD